MNAPTKATEIKAVFSAAIAFCTAIWGQTGWAIIILLVAIALDYLTGSWAAMHRGEWSSAVARQGLWHKLGEIVSLLVAALTDIALKVITAGGIDLPEKIGEFTVPQAAFTLLVAFWYIFTELGSIVENVAELGAPVPKFLIKALEKVKKETDPDSENQE